MRDLDGPVFFALVNRLTAYRGVIREIALMEQDTNTSGEPVNEIDGDSHAALGASDLGQGIEFD